MQMDKNKCAIWNLHDLFKSEKCVWEKFMNAYETGVDMEVK